MTQDQLAHTMFPLGSMRKTEVRAIAEENGFVNAEKPDSQDICFVPNGDYGSIIELQTGSKPVCGNFVDKQGNVIGKHKGLIYYTSCHLKPRAAVCMRNLSRKRQYCPWRKRRFI